MRISNGQDYKQKVKSKNDSIVIFLKFDSLKTDSFIFPIPQDCQGYLPNFIRPNSAKTNKAFKKGISFYSFSVDSCINESIIEKLDVGYKSGYKDTNDIKINPAKKDTYFNLNI